MTAHGVTRYLKKNTGILFQVFIFFSVLLSCNCLLDVCFFKLLFSTDAKYNLKMGPKKCCTFSKKLGPKMEQGSLNEDKNVFLKPSACHSVVYSTLVASLCNISRMLTSFFFFLHLFIHVNTK